MPSETAGTNRLINEKSPYLLQHAHNPVDWYPWGDDAFNKAKAEDKPVFLSIGYSTCHWCHVMARESFEDEAVAEILNRSFVSVKVDREERPDVDAFYMEACMALNGSGGWPLSCFLTPDRGPFFTGTYFPKEDGPYSPGFMTLLRRIAELWKNNKNELISTAEALSLRAGRPRNEKVAGKSAGRDKWEWEDAAVRELAANFDEDFGGFGGAPKFPSLPTILFLILCGAARKDGRTLQIAKKTLDGMSAGGIFDQIGGGFCRYSTDREWLVPHFEKMMYDNALHILAYAEAGALLDPSYLETARSVAGFCLGEMLDPGGGFYTALDADSEGAEGKFYLWTPDEVEKVLGETDGRRCSYLYHITRGGNFEGKNIPNLIGTRLTGDDRRFLGEAGKKLYEFRSKRMPPARDDKVSASVNGLMVAALSVLWRVSGEKRFLDAAGRCAGFVLKKLFSNGRLKSYWRDGTADAPASLDDHAYLVWGLLELYESDFNPVWLKKALALTKSLDAHYRDGERGGYFISASDAVTVPARHMQLEDGPLPSGNSVMASNLVRLSRILAEPEYERRAGDILELMAAGLEHYPTAFCGALCADLYLKSPGREVVFASGGGLTELIGALPGFAPFTTAAVCGEGYEEAVGLAPFLGEYKSVGGKAAAYLCSGGACHPPVTDPGEFSRLLSAFPEFPEN